MLADVGNFIGNKLQGLFETHVTDERVAELIDEICRELLHANVGVARVASLRSAISSKIDLNAIHGNTNRAKMVQKVVVDEIARMLGGDSTVVEFNKNEQHTVVFVGLQGAGKTTSVCKYAYYYKRRGMRVGVVCADTFRAGAFDQAKQNCDRIGVEAFTLPGETDPVRVSRAGVAHFRKGDCELILIDTSGRHHQEEGLFQEMREICDAVDYSRIYLVMDAGMGQSAESQAAAFGKAVPLGGIILTKVDGAAKAGGALAGVAATGCPIEYIGTGEAMGSLEQFDSRRFIARLLNCQNLEQVLKNMADLDLNPDEITSKFKEGTFTLGDFKHFYSQISSLGPMTNLLQMVPGVGKVDIPDERKMRRVNYIFDSMHESELMSVGECFGPSRIRRVALGSGTTREQVNELLANFKKMSQVAKKLMNTPGFSEMFR